MNSIQNSDYLSSLFIQAFMSKKVLTIEETKILYSKICEVCEGIFLKNILNLINICIYFL